MNDAGFWMIKDFFNLTVAQTLVLDGYGNDYIIRFTYPNLTIEFNCLRERSML
ncbi:hypothetical protein [Bacillus sp. ISL-34]|uniref:GntT/GntP/DsdX family permease n=1 Tax=Bacillus sp. ISL-34 TaxID=2819121 RepID=UPI002852E304|nr:hypothetical protein [Bacillus sp. ISL-34]